MARRSKPALPGRISSEQRRDEDHAQAHRQGPAALSLAHAVRHRGPDSRVHSLSPQEGGLRREASENSVTGAILLKKAKKLAVISPGQTPDTSPGNSMKTSCLL